MEKWYDKYFVSVWVRGYPLFYFFGQSALDVASQIALFLDFSLLFYPSIVTRSQGYYQDQFVMFAVLESAKPSGGEWINCCIENVTMRPERVVLHQFTSEYYVFRLESCKIEGFFSNSKIIIFLKNKILAHSSEIRGLRST